MIKMRQSDFKKKYDPELGRFTKTTYSWRRSDGRIQKYWFKVIWTNNEKSC